jgi:hypothetical protein
MNTLDVKCPTCLAKPGKPCRVIGKIGEGMIDRSEAHDKRVDLATRTRRPPTLEEKRLHDAATVPGFDPSRDGALANAISTVRVRALLNDLWGSLNETAPNSCADAVEEMTLTVEAFANEHHIELDDYEDADESYEDDEEDDPAEPEVDEDDQC